MTIKPPSGISPSGTTPVSGTAPQAPASKAQAPAPAATPSVINPEAVAKALKDYQKIQDKLKQPMLAGASGLFSENIIFPPEMLDPKNPLNDPKYLHLMFAVFGLKELEKYLKTVEQRAEDEGANEDEEKTVKTDPPKPPKKPKK